MGSGSWTALEAERNAGDNVMRQRRDANRATGDTQMVQVGVRKFVLGKKRPVPSQVEVRSRKGLDAGAVPLVVFVAHPADDGFHVGDYRADANPDIRLEAAKKVLSAFAGQPPIHHVGGEKIQAMREVERV